MPRKNEFEAEVMAMETLQEDIRDKLCYGAPATDRFAMLKDAFSYEKSHYIAMDFAPGLCFSKLCEKYQFPDYTALTLLEEVVKGLAVLETTSLIEHGDLSSTNVIVNLT